MYNDMHEYMKNNPYNPSQWKHLIPNIEDVIAEIEKHPILSIGVAPFVRIIPTFFLNNFSVYSVSRSSDADVLEQYMPLIVLEDTNPDFANRVHGTNYLIKHVQFQKFYSELRPRPHLMLNTITEDLIATMRNLNYPFLGNVPATYNEVKFKTDFRKLLVEYGLNAPLAETYRWEDFQSTNYSDLKNKFGESFVLQRGDKEVGNNEGTFFVHSEENLKTCIESLNKGIAFEEIIVTQFLTGNSVSMLGCATAQGTLSGPLQLQLIDIPESLHGLPKNGIFFGNDLGFHPWGAHIESEAQKAVEAIGAHLFKIGYRGIFGLDYIYDDKQDKIFAIECNPRSPGSLLLYSLALLEAHVPPMDLFHLAAQLNLNFQFDFEKVNKAMKIHAPYSHISFSPKNMNYMRLPLLAGVYNFNKEKDELVYKGAGISLADLKDKNDFLIADTVPKVGKVIEKSVPRLFKFIFPQSIGLSSNKIDERAAYLVDRFVSALIQADK
jgi:predicted ATP-grasp superfamily ATP-dependent carboligase